MKKLRFILLLLIILCTGCSVEYNLEINEDLSVNEEVVALEDQSFYDQYYKSTISRVIDLVMSRNKDYLEQNNYIVEKIIDKKSGVNIKNTFSNLNEYYNTSKFDTQLFSEFKYDKIENIVELSAKGLMIKETDLIERYLIDDAKINIKLPFKVIDTNADSYDYTTNTYSWDITQDTEYKEVYLKFNTNKKATNYKSIFTGLIISIVCIVIIVLIMWIVNKKKVNNKI